VGLELAAGLRPHRLGLVADLQRPHRGLPPRFQLRVSPRAGPARCPAPGR
jgi:hypothetical protein